MRTIVIVFITAILTGLAVWILKPNKEPVNNYRIDTIRIKGDSIAYPVLVDGKPIIREVLVFDTFWKNKPIDTFAILSQFFAVNCFSDTFRKDSSYLLILKEKVSQNRIFDRNIFLQNLRETKIINNVTTVDNSGLFAGIYGGNKSFGIEATYLSKNKLYGLGVGTNGITLKVSFKIK
jgi:hypothetical protein